MGNWTQTLKSWLEMLWEFQCPLCQRSTPQAFCQDCQRQIQRCQLSQPNQLWHSSLPLFAWGSYRDALKRAIACLKYNHQPQIARPLGHWLAQSWINSPARAGSPRLIVVPIPMHGAKRQQRGYNQAELLAQSFCEMTGLPLQSQGLERVRTTEAQFGLSALDREQNLQDAFKVGKGLSPHRGSAQILLVDDIYTTGATARSAVKTLQQSGLKVLGMVVVAKAEQSKHPRIAN